jgi:hypothetical protein
MSRRWNHQYSAYVNIRQRSELVATGEWSQCVMSCRIGWMATACGAGKSGIRGPAAGVCGSLAVLGPTRPGPGSDPAAVIIDA